MANIIKIKRGSGTPTTSNLAEYQLGYDYTNNKLYIHDPTNSSGQEIVEVGGSGASTSGSNNQILTDDGSGGINSESNLTFNGHLLTVSGDNANGINMAADGNNTSNSERIFFTGSSTGAIFQSGTALSFRSGATAGSSSGTQQMYINSSGLTVTNNLTVTGASTFNYGAVFNEGGNNSDFRVESQNQTHQLHVDASADLVKTVNLRDDRTHIGYTSGHGLEPNQMSIQDWCDLPTGFHGMMRSGNQSYGNPGSTYFYFHKLSKRFWRWLGW